jgi:hypothetical protein
VCGSEKIKAVPFQKNKRAASWNFLIREFHYPSQANKEGATMRYKPRSLTALQVAIGGLPDAMHVDADKGLGVSAKTVGELRKVAAWPDNLVITTPQQRYPGSSIKVSKANMATRVSPKP